MDEPIYWLYITLRDNDEFDFFPRKKRKEGGKMNTNLTKMINKIAFLAGAPFSVIGVAFWMIGYPFGKIARLLGHKYWRI